MFDYVVVGAGSAGCVVAGRLTEDSTSRVLILEAGGPDTRLEIATPSRWLELGMTDVDWGYVTQMQPKLHHRAIHWPRGKVLGGSSSLNAMMYVRGHASDFDHWAELGNRGWSYREVLPYFKKSEHQERGASAFHGTDGSLNVADPVVPDPIVASIIAAARQVGIEANDDFNGPVQDGVGFGQVTMIDGSRCSAADAFLRPAMARDSVTVVTGAQVTRLLLDGKRVTGVRYRHGEEEHEVLAGREVILCGGAINSPQLLMLSGIGPTEHLRTHGITPVLDLPGVGLNLQDHLGVVVSYRSTLLDPIPQTSNYVEGDCFVRTLAGLPAPDVQIILGVANAEGFDRPPVYSLLPLVLRPQSRGRVRLASSDPLAAPHIDPSYLSVDADLDVLVRGFTMARAIGGASALDPIRDVEIVPGSGVRSDEAVRDFIRESATTVFHPVGTCAMGTGALAVVDQRLQVHGLQGLRVVDASIMPTITGGNTHAPVMMIAEKAADMIKQDATPG